MGRALPESVLECGPKLPVTEHDVVELGRHGTLAVQHEVGLFAEKEPPPLKVEVEGRPPSKNHIWIKGYWHWDGKAYGWNGGHWEFNSNPKRVWEEAKWEKQGAKFHFVAGHWK